METIIDQKQELTIIDKSLPIFKNGSVILVNHQLRASKALKVGQSILEQWETASTIQDSEQRKIAFEVVDKRSNDFLANCGNAKNNMEDSRKAITQLMDVIRKMFIDEESKLDPKRPGIPMDIQLKRNQFARDLLAEQERLRREAEARAAKSHEENEMRSYIKNSITQKLLDFLAWKKRTITDLFNAITLKIFEEKSEKLKAMSTAFPESKCEDIIRYTDPVYSLHNPKAFEAIKTEEHHAFNFQSFYKEYDRQITELKQSLIDRLPAKKQELDEIAAADAEEKLKLEEQQKQRELEEKVRLQKEEEQRKLEADQKAEMEKSSASTQIMFDQVADTAVMTPAPETRSGYEITILNKAGIVELFQFWFTREAVTLTIDEMMKKTLVQIKAYAEACARKDDVRIESKNLKYEAAIKSVNRKPVK